ncbi:hypothetical protein [Azospirillum brasilense]|uniref:hypothetical protein n=1 Tax=Azospirillum brasilense TaxID=192 RepID=UPI0011A2CB71|nr:hypothetical protein [Azospirillum brasilense]
MATASDIAARGDFIPFRGDLEDDEMPQRTLYLTKDCELWLRTVLVNVPQPPRRKLHPSDEVWSVFVDFIMGRPMAYNVHLKKLDPLGKHVWEFKPIGVRIFGYFYLKATFVAHHGEMKSKLIPNSKYDPHIDDVHTYINTIDLDPPPCITQTGLAHVL